MIQINGISLPPPVEYRLSYQDRLGQKQINALGKVVRDVLGKKRRVQIGYKHLSGVDAKLISDLVSASDELMLFCPSLTGDEVFSCRLESIQSALFHRENGQDVWADVSVILEEV